MALAAPALAGLRWSRAVSAWWRGRSLYGFSWAMPLWAAIMSLQWSLAEGWAYLFGDASALRSIADVEHNRLPFIRAGEGPFADTRYSIARDGARSPAADLAGMRHGSSP
jgi:hypothetical protein